jgi:hypothetical protein
MEVGVDAQIFGVTVPPPYAETVGSSGLARPGQGLVRIEVAFPRP